MPSGEAGGNLISHSAAAVDVVAAGWCGAAVMQMTGHV